jgi:ferrous iron transport protein B
VDSSYLAAVGRFLTPLGALLGVGWQMMVALLTSFVAKENTIATLSVLLGAGAEGSGLAQVLPTLLTPASALAFLIVQVLFIPCAATVATIRQETGSWKWTALSVGMLFVISFTVGIGAYQLARLVGWGV